MSQTIELSDESVALLRRQAEAHCMSLDHWVAMLAREKSDELQRRHEKAQTAIAQILEVQQRVKPHPEGWTIRDYIEHGRR